MKIYAADDEALALEFLEKSIRKVAPDAELVCFNKSRDLLKKMSEEPCDTVVLDVEMPGMTGIELAQRIKEYNPNVNIIFATGYSEYMPDALKLFASGYVLKPVTEGALRDQFNNLRHPVNSDKAVSAKCFGHFDLIVNEKPVNFHLSKSKELLAYLIDRNGAIVSRREVYSVLYEDEPYDRNGQKKLSKTVHGLESDLKDAGAEYIFIRESDGYRIDKKAIYCELFDFLDEGKSYYHGEYMEQYSWGEDFKGRMLDSMY